jgi:hydroxypyruvate isomerase
MHQVTRREALAAGAAALAGGFAPPGAAPDVAERLRRSRHAAPQGRAVTKGRLKQSVSRWPYAKIPMPEFCKAVAGMGLTAIDLLGEADWTVVGDHGLICSMGNAGGGSIPNGLNVKANHDAIVRNFEQNLPKAAAQKVPNVITFFGNRRGMSDSEATDNCVEGLNRVKKIGEDTGVTICVELLNSKIDHKDYQGDRSAFGLAIVKAVGSPRVKLLYDIYHMQIMEGDIIRTIRDNRDYFAHFHTGGVPGRHELDATQELNWATVCAAIADTGFQGYVAHEFVPTRDPLTSLREAVVMCDV